MHTADHPVEIGFVRGLLESEGIETRVQGMDLWTAAVEIYFADGARPSVWVRDAMLERARRVLAEADRRGQGEDWTCPDCGERLEGQFKACWRCARDRNDGHDNDHDNGHDDDEGSLRA
ncbi:hypothetical protein WM2015_658 [Wenzhouxiangella marina]|uniref:DUF2007 domain-containing protein n=1 Tax=Wenzhouxiangella marina TaxID=1579979 RepID=A0A0K0XTK0_9GAMM|nr:hypothetical protein WM2015_658 [Wenzhouxiangella marina]